MNGSSRLLVLDYRVINVIIDIKLACVLVFGNALILFSEVAVYCLLLGC